MQTSGLDNFVSIAKLESPRQISTVGKFYFLDYFYIFLKCVQSANNEQHLFEHFKFLKHKYRLGESKYKKLSVDPEDLSINQENRYKYTFKQVVEESKQYRLIRQDNNIFFTLTEQGEELIDIYETSGQYNFNLELFKLMESTYRAFRHIIDLLYNNNSEVHGLLILPHFSPRMLGLERATIKTTKDIKNYSSKLLLKIKKEIYNYIGINIDPQTESCDFVDKLIIDGYLPQDASAHFDPQKYNVIIKKFRDFWINYLLKNIYRYDYSASSFDFWTYRGKQIGLLQATEFHPHFNGRLVYATSVLHSKSHHQDFKEVFCYRNNERLYIHEPDMNQNRDLFVDNLVKAYYKLRRDSRTYFVSLPSLKELVCYYMKFSDYQFTKFLDDVYRLNLKGSLRIKISLEVDKLPEETKAMYLKKEPVVVAGKARNIIAIDVAKDS